MLVAADVHHIGGAAAGGTGDRRQQGRGRRPAGIRGATQRSIR
jgi:hypothetical protein